MRTAAVVGVVAAVALLVPKTALGKIAISQGTVLGTDGGTLIVARGWQGGLGDIIRVRLTGKTRIVRAGKDDTDKPGPRALVPGTPVVLHIHGSRVGPDADVWLADEVRVGIGPLPPWVRPNVKTEAFEGTLAEAGGANLLAKQLVGRIALAGLKGQPAVSAYLTADTKVIRLVDGKEEPARWLDLKKGAAVRVRYLGRLVSAVAAGTPQAIATEITIVGPAR